MLDFLIIAIVVFIVGMAVRHIVKAKKSGVKCIGCPSGCSCEHHHSNDGKCHCHDEH